MNATPQSRPQSVTTAVILLVLVLVVGLISTFYQSTHNAVMQSMSDQLPTMKNIMYVAWVVVFVAELFFIYKIFLGKNWARITMLVLFILGALLSIPAYLGMGSIPLSTSVKILGSVSMAVNLVAYIMLFTGQGSTWFKKRVG